MNVFGETSRSSGHILRSFSILFMQMLEYLKSKEDFVNAIVKHLGTSAVMDLLLRLITSVESPQLRQDLLEVKLTVCVASLYIIILLFLCFV